MNTISRSLHLAARVFVQKRFCAKFIYAGILAISISSASGGMYAQSTTEPDGHNTPCQPSGPAPGPCYIWEGYPTCGWVTWQPDGGCASGHHWDDTVCACVCDATPPSGGCPKYHHWDDTQCACVCDNGAVPGTCNNGETWDDKVCSCDCGGQFIDPDYQGCCNSIPYSKIQSSTKYTLDFSGLNNVLNYVLDAVGDDKYSLVLPSASVDGIKYNECCNGVIQEHHKTVGKVQVSIPAPPLSFAVIGAPYVASAGVTISGSAGADGSVSSLKDCDTDETCLSANLIADMTGGPYGQLLNGALGLSGTAGVHVEGGMQQYCIPEGSPVYNACATFHAEFIIKLAWMSSYQWKWSLPKICYN